jgi:hypothetical protein
MTTSGKVQKFILREMAARQETFEANET